MLVIRYLVPRSTSARGTFAYRYCTSSIFLNKENLTCIGIMVRQCVLWDSFKIFSDELGSVTKKGCGVSDAFASSDELLLRKFRRSLGGCLYSGERDQCTVFGGRYTVSLSNRSGATSASLDLEVLLLVIMFNHALTTML